MRINLFWRTLPVYFVVLALFAVPVYHQQQARERAQAAGVALARKIAVVHRAPAIPKFSGVPVRIVIPRLSVDVGIVPGAYDSNSSVWSVSSSYANYANNTVPANNFRSGGKTFIYGHWTTAVFGNTKDLTPGDIAYVTTDNNHIFTYVYQSNTVIKPTDTAWLSDLAGRPGLVLMTCQGLWAQDRRLMFFNLKQAV